MLSDARFRKFDSITSALKGGKKARATLVGWGVAAKLGKDDSGNQQDVGYGPYGMYSLLVIQKVEAVSRR